jgi:hypothetical protein
MSGENRANRNLVSHQWQELCLKLTTFPLSNKHTQIHLHTHGDGTNAQLAVVSDWHWQGWRFAGRSHRRHPNDFGAQGLEQVTRLITIHHLSTPKTKKKYWWCAGPTVSGGKKATSSEKASLPVTSSPNDLVNGIWTAGPYPLSRSYHAPSPFFSWPLLAAWAWRIEYVYLFIYALEKKKGFCVGWEKAKEKDKEMACREVSLLPVGQPFVRPRKGADCRMPPSSYRTGSVISDMRWWLKLV